MGLARELVDAANSLGPRHRKVVGQRSNGDWALIVVLAVQREGQKNNIYAEYLDSKDHEKLTFTFFSDEPIGAEGDFFSIRKAELSFLHPRTFEPCLVTIGGRVALSTPEHTSAKIRTEASLERKQRNGSKLPTVRVAVTSRLQRQTVAPHGDLTENEMKHFGTDIPTLGNTLNQLTSVIRRYAREGTRKPADVSIRLQREGFRTASGATWTTRLTFFLLKLIFFDPAKDGQAGKARPRRSDRGMPAAAKGGDDKLQTTAAVPLQDHHMTIEQMADRLGFLGRVTKRSK